MPVVRGKWCGARGWRRLFFPVPRTAHRASLLFMLLTACATWQVETAAPAEFIRQQKPRSVRVVLTDSSRVLIADPVIRSDSIAGDIRLMDPMTGPPRLQNLPVAVALADVASVSVARVNTRRTAMLFAPIGVAALVAAIVIAGD